MEKVFRAFLLILVLFSIIFLPVRNIEAERFSPWEIEKLVGNKAPEFTIKDISGKEVSLSSFFGNPILLNFWATWCPYCREERPRLNALSSEYKEKGLVIIAVSTDRSIKTVQEYLKKIPSEFVVLYDNNKEAAGSYGVYALPTSFLIDRKGIVKHKFMGLRRWTGSESKQLIDKLLEK